MKTRKTFIRETSIDTLIYLSVVESGNERGAIAEAVGDPLSYFSKKINPDDITCHIKPHQLLPLIQSSRDSRIIEWLVQKTWPLFGMVLVKTRPKVMFKGEDFSEHIKKLVEYEAALGKWRNREMNTSEMVKVIDKLQGEIASVRLAVQTENRQPELEFTGGKK
jgi:hypothetical protein